MAQEKIIHFIWAGGEKLLHPRNINVISKWAIAHPDFSIWLWIDKKTAVKWKDLNQIYKKKFNNLKNLYCKDIEEETGISSPEIRYEIDRVDPNYGASSDLLRLCLWWYLF